MEKQHSFKDTKQLNLILKKCFSSLICRTGLAVLTASIITISSSKANMPPPGDYLKILDRQVEVPYGDSYLVYDICYYGPGFC